MQRQAASKRLEDIGEAAFEALSNVAARSEDPEVRHRAEKLVRAIAKRMFVVVRRIGWQDTVQGIPAHIYHSTFSPDSRLYLAGGDIGTAPRGVSLSPSPFTKRLRCGPQKTSESIGPFV
jgi:hypothetical protein